MLITVVDPAHAGSTIGHGDEVSRLSREADSDDVLVEVEAPAPIIAGRAKQKGAEEIPVADAVGYLQSLDDSIADADQAGSDENDEGDQLATTAEYAAELLATKKKLQREERLTATQRQKLDKQAKELQKLKHQEKARLREARDKLEARLEKKRVVFEKRFRTKKEAVADKIFRKMQVAVTEARKLKKRLHSAKALVDQAHQREAELEELQATNKKLQARREASLAQLAQVTVQKQRLTEQLRDAKKRISSPSHKHRMVRNFKKLLKRLQTLNTQRHELQRRQHHTESQLQKAQKRAAALESIHAKDAKLKSQYKNMLDRLSGMTAHQQELTTRFEAERRALRATEKKQQQIAAKLRAATTAKAQSEASKARYKKRLQAKSRLLSTQKAKFRQELRHEHDAWRKRVQHQKTLRHAALTKELQAEQAGLAKAQSALQAFAPAVSSSELLTTTTPWKRHGSTLAQKVAATREERLEVESELQKQRFAKGLATQRKMNQKEVAQIRRSEREAAAAKLRQQKATLLGQMRRQITRQLQKSSAAKVAAARKKAQEMVEVEVQRRLKEEEKRSALKLDAVIDQGAEVLKEERQVIHDKDAELQTVQAREAKKVKRVRDAMARRLQRARHDAAIKLEAAKEEESKFKEEESKFKEEESKFKEEEEAAKRALRRQKQRAATLQRAEEKKVAQKAQLAREHEATNPVDGRLDKEIASSFSQLQAMSEEFAGGGAPIAPPAAADTASHGSTAANSRAEEDRLMAEEGVFLQINQAVAAPTEATVMPHADSDPGAWPPTDGWATGSLELAKGAPAPPGSSGARGHAWPSGLNRSPEYHFKGSGSYDGGKTMREWVEAEGARVPMGLKTAALKYDFDRLEAGKKPTSSAGSTLGLSKLEGAIAPEHASLPGEWPPTNDWVGASEGSEAPSGTPMVEISTAPEATPQEPGKWPPTMEWTKGSLRVPGSSRSRDTAQRWPSSNAAPSVSFEGKGEYDGGAEMRKWVSGKGLPVPTGLKTAALNYDFDKLDAGQTPTAKDKTFDQLKSGIQDHTDQPGAWPPTSDWVQSGP